MMIDVDVNLTFVCPCIAIIIANDDQKDATILAYVFIPIFIVPYILIRSNKMQ